MGIDAVATAFGVLGSQGSSAVPTVMLRISPRLRQLARSSALAVAALCPLAFAQQLPAPVQLQIQYDTSKAPGHPDEQETLANILYPVGKGPTTQGYPAEGLPVLVMVRGGNSNSWSVGDVVFEEQTMSATPFGMIGVRANMPVWEGPPVAAADAKH